MRNNGGRPSTFDDGGYRELYDFAPLMWVVLDANAVILEINAAGAAMLGAGPDFIRGTPLRIWVHSDWRPAIADHLRRCRSTDEAVESTLLLKPADDRPGVIVRLVSRRTLFRNALVLASVGLDVTEQESLDAARRTAERQRDLAEEDRRIARAAESAKDRLIAMVSHELRNPLSPALIAASTLANWQDLPDGARQLAVTIERNIQVEARLIDDLLDVARVTRGQLDLRMQAADLHAILEHAIDATAEGARERGVVVVTDFRAAPHFVRGDAARLEQVFWNLLSNAVKFSHPGGQVTIRTSCNAAGVLVVAIRDFGAGMDHHTLQHLFAPFEKPRVPSGGRAGLGLGLTIARSIVEHHGGQVWAASDGPGTGALFEVEMASCEPPAESPVPSGDTDEQVRPHQRGRVLIVEDHPDTGELLAACLEQSGYEVHLAQTLSDGLAALENGWDVVLSDIGLSDGSGLEIARRASNGHRRPARLVALSGYGADADIQASRSAGFDMHLVKPIDLSQLLRVLEGSA